MARPTAPRRRHRRRVPGPPDASRAPGRRLPSRGRRRGRGRRSVSCWVMTPPGTWARLELGDELGRQLAQPAQGVPGLGLHGVRGAAEHVGGLDLGAVLEEAQHQHRALAWGEPGQGLLQDEPVDRAGVGRGGPWAGHALRRVDPPARPPAAGPTAGATRRSRAGRGRCARRASGRHPRWSAAATGRRPGSGSPGPGPRPRTCRSSGGRRSAAAVATQRARSRRSPAPAPPPVACSDRATARHTHTRIRGPTRVEPRNRLDVRTVSVERQRRRAGRPRGRAP